MCVFAFACMCVYVCVRAFVCACVYVCACICVCQPLMARPCYTTFSIILSSMAVLDLPVQSPHV